MSFYDGAMEEGCRRDDPARQTRRPKAKPPKVYRLTRAEAAAFLAAAETVRERRIAHIGICAGARNGELRGLQGRHFRRAGWVWISADIAKGGRQRWIPVLPELEPTAREIRETVALDEYVIPAQRWRDPGANSLRGELSRRPSSSQALRTAVMELAARAGIHAHVHPHVMRHAFGDHFARFAGIKNRPGAARTRGRRDDADLYRGANARRAGGGYPDIRFAEESERVFYPSRSAPQTR